DVSVAGVAQPGQGAGQREARVGQRHAGDLKARRLALLRLRGLDDGSFTGGGDGQGGGTNGADREEISSSKRGHGGLLRDADELFSARRRRASAKRRQSICRRVPFGARIASGPELARLL